MKEFFKKLNIIPDMEYVLKYQTEDERNKTFDLIKFYEKFDVITYNISSKNLHLFFEISNKDDVFDVLNYQIEVDILKIYCRYDYILIPPSWKYNELYINNVKQDNYSFMVLLNKRKRLSEFIDIEDDDLTNIIKKLRNKSKITNDYESIKSNINMIFLCVKNIFNIIKKKTNEKLFG